MMMMMMDYDVDDDHILFIIFILLLIYYLLYYYLLLLSSYSFLSSSTYDIYDTYIYIGCFFRILMPEVGLRTTTASCWMDGVKAIQI